jgi:hypothetical protein
MGVDLILDSSGLKKLDKSLSNFKEQIPAATTSALNRTLDYTSTQWRKLITERYAIKSTEIKDSISKKPASKSNLSASLNVRGSRLSFVHFPFSPKMPGTHRAVKVKILKDGGSKQIKTQNKPFIAPTGAKSADKVQYNVFKRTTEKRKPIVVLRTLSIPQMASYKGISERVQTIAAKKLEERIDHEIQWRLKKAAERGAQ